MAELSINQLIKIILGVIVFMVVVLGIYFFFRNYVISFFKNIIPTNSTEIFLSLIK